MLLNIAKTEAHFPNIAALEAQLGFGAGAHPVQASHNDTTDPYELHIVYTPAMNDFINAGGKNPATQAVADLRTANGNYQAAQNTLASARTTLLTTLATGSMTTGSNPITQQLLFNLAEQLALAILQRGSF